jgi:hypothetical protein
MILRWKPGELALRVVAHAHKGVKSVHEVGARAPEGRGAVPRPGQRLDPPPQCSPPSSPLSPRGHSDRQLFRAPPHLGRQGGLGGAPRGARRRRRQSPPPPGGATRGHGAAHPVARQRQCCPPARLAPLAAQAVSRSARSPAAAAEACPMCARYAAMAPSAAAKAAACRGSPLAAVSHRASSAGDAASSAVM